MNEKPILEHFVFPFELVDHHCIRFPTADTHQVQQLTPHLMDSIRITTVTGDNWNIGQFSYTKVLEVPLPIRSRVGKYYLYRIIAVGNGVRPSWNELLLHSIPQKYDDNTCVHCGRDMFEPIFLKAK